MSQITLAVRRISQSLATLCVFSGCISSARSQAEPITSATDGTDTVVTTPDGNRFDITQGTQSGTNLFHSFEQFGLDANQIANFIANPAIQNILGRVVGGNASLINGLIQVTGEGNPNLFLMNPAGIMFGPNASLDVPASFTATTATGIGIGESWFNASGDNNYASLAGTPNAFAFTTAQPGSIINSGSLSVEAGNLTLLGGTVVSTGQLSAPAGQVTVAAIAGERLVRITQQGMLLNLEIQPLPATGGQMGTWTLPVNTLPQLLTGGGGNNATEVIVNSQGQVELVGSGLQVQNGDVVVKQTTAQTATLSANNDLTLIESQLLTTEDLNLLAQGRVRIQDSAENFFIAEAEGNLRIQANLGIDIRALSHGQTVLQSGRNMSIVSDGQISVDAHPTSGANLEIRRLSGVPAASMSSLDPIWTAQGNVVAGDYTGAALKVEAGGSIEMGNITITQPDTLSQSIPADDPDFIALTTTRALILNAATGSITTGHIDTSSNNQDAGSVRLTAQGDIITGNIRTVEQNQVGNSGSVNIFSNQGSIDTGIINSSNAFNGSAGDVTLSAATSITFDRINTANRGAGDAGDVTLSVPEDISDSFIGRIDMRNFGPGNNGTLTINSNNPIDPQPPSPGLQPPPPGLQPPPPEPEPLPPDPPSPLPDPQPSPIDTQPSPIDSQPSPIDSQPSPIDSQSPRNPSTDNSNSSTSENSNGATINNSGEQTISAEPEQQTTSNPENLDSSVEQTSTDVDLVHQLEEAFTKEYEEYLDRSVTTNIKNQDEVRNRTRQIEQATGIKTGVIYASFPSTPGAVPDTQCQTNSQPSGDLPQRDRRFGYRRSELAQQPERCLAGANDQLELLLITADGEPIRTRVAGVNRANVSAAIVEFQQALTNPKHTNSSNYLPSAQQLYRWLIAPLEPKLQAGNIKSLVFVMDGGLRSLPLAALHDGQGFLVERYGISVVPSMSLTDSHYRDIRPMQVLAMGASKFADQAPLPGVQVELATIAEQLWRGKFFLNESFTLENLKAQRRQQEFGIVHLATHAEFKPGSPENSYIQLWDRKLRLSELRELELSDPPVELLVLSACRTAMGNQEAELGFAGSALQAGVDSTLATLWYVSDRGSLGLTTEFYHHLHQVPIKSEALRRAQLAMIKGNVRIENNQLYNSGKSVSLPAGMSASGTQSLSHPYYWAGFMLVGDPW